MANFSSQGQGENSRKGNSEPARFVDGIIRNNAPARPQVKKPLQKQVPKKSSITQEQAPRIEKKQIKRIAQQPSQKNVGSIKRQKQPKRSWFSRIFARSKKNTVNNSSTRNKMNNTAVAGAANGNRARTPTIQKTNPVVATDKKAEKKIEKKSPASPIADRSSSQPTRFMSGIRPVAKRPQQQEKPVMQKKIAHVEEKVQLKPEKMVLEEKITSKKDSSKLRVKRSTQKEAVKKPARVKSKKKKPVRSYKSPHQYQSIFASKNRRLRGLVRGLGVLGLVIGGVMLGGAYLFDRAKVFVKPVSFILPVQQRVDISNTGRENAIELEYVVFSGTVKQEISIEERTQTPIKASGKLVLYNETDKEQQLSPSTRFESEDGLVYLGPEEAIIIPAQDAKTPGITEILVTAEKAGPQYNTSQAARFVIPAWRESNSPKFDLQYGRSPAGIIGGAEQGVYVISPDLRNQVIVPMRQSLQQSMLTHAVVDVPDGFVFFEQAFLLDTDELEIIEDNRGRATHVALKGRGALILFPQDELVQTIFQDHNYQGGDELVELLAITNPSNVNMTYSEEAQEFMRRVLRQRKIEEETNTDLGLTASEQIEGGNFQIGLNGDIGFRADIDINALEEDIAGTERLVWQDIFSTNNGIERASVDLKPFWKKRAPGNTNDIVISIEK